MKRNSVIFFVVLVLIAFFNVFSALASDRGIKITKPANNSTVHGEVEVCMEVHGLEVEPAKKGVNEDRGHHHLFIDVDLPGNLSTPIGKDAHHVHMGDGSTCKKLKLNAGKHTIHTLFAKGNHVPYSPAVTDTVSVTVE